MTDTANTPSPRADHHPHPQPSAAARASAAQPPHPAGAAADFVVGGQDRQLTEEQQLEALQWYLGEHYPAPDFTAPWALPGQEGQKENDTQVAARRAEGDRWAAHLPDRLTHAAMMQLGAAVDHSLPGTAWTTAVTLEPVELPGGAATRISPATITAPVWTISLHGGGFWRGGGMAREMNWLPEMAAVAQLSGTEVLDLDYPLYPEATLLDAVRVVRAAVVYAREHGAEQVVLLGASAGAVLAQACAPHADALLLQRPSQGLTRLPAAFRAGVELPEPRLWPTTLIQEGTRDSRVPPVPDEWERLPQVTVRRYVADHQIITPAVARRRAQDAARFIAGVGTTPA